MKRPLSLRKQIEDLRKRNSELIKIIEATAERSDRRRTTLKKLLKAHELLKYKYSSHIERFKKFQKLSEEEEEKILDAQRQKFDSWIKKTINKEF